MINSVLLLTPFGETYPEEDLARRTSFYRIKKYIENGGIFLNSTGIPFYYMFNGSGNKLITGEPLEWRTSNGIPFIVKGHTNFLHSWLRKNFGLRTTIGPEENLVTYQLSQDRNIAGNLVNLLDNESVTEFRSSTYHRHLIPLLRALKPADSPIEECYPLAAVKFGFGYLIPAGITPLTANWFNVLLTAIYNLSHALASQGTLSPDLD